MPDSRRDARDPRDAAVADDWCWGAEAEGEGHAVEAETEQCSRRRARQSIREYELICCCSSAYVQCLGLTGACAACSHCTATAWESSDLDHSHAATPRRVTRASCALVLRSVLLLGLLAVDFDLLEALDRCVCMRRARCFCLRISHFYCLC